MAKTSSTKQPSSIAFHVERDDKYAIVSALYHSLQGAETYSKYVEDAERAGDEDLVEFFRTCHDEDMERARKARFLLEDRFQTSSDDDE